MWMREGIRLHPFSEMAKPRNKHQIRVDVQMEYGGAQFVIWRRRKDPKIRWFRARRGPHSTRQVVCVSDTAVKYYNKHELVEGELLYLLSREINRALMQLDWQEQRKGPHA